jgi:hypothetical protein
MFSVLETAVLPVRVRLQAFELNLRIRSLNQKKG